MVSRSYRGGGSNLEAPAQVRVIINAFLGREARVCSWGLPGLVRHPRRVAPPTLTYSFAAPFLTYLPTLAFSYAAPNG